MSVVGPPKPALNPQTPRRFPAWASPEILSNPSQILPYTIYPPGPPKWTHKAPRPPKMEPKWIPKSTKNGPTYGFPQNSYFEDSCIENTYFLVPDTTILTPQTTLKTRLQNQSPNGTPQQNTQCPRGSQKGTNRLPNGPQNGSKISIHHLLGPPGSQ